MTEMITIPKKEYKMLVKCKRIVESEFEERFSKEFIDDIKNAEKEYEKGQYKKFDTAADAQRHLDSL